MPKKQLESDWASQYYNCSVRQCLSKISPHGIREYVTVDFRDDFGLDETGNIVSQRNIEKEKTWHIQLIRAKTRAHRVVIF